jgi:23S rRNA (guanosine2251-2'-O)-methyltransferase
MTASQMLHDLNFVEPCAIVMGSEGKGVFSGIQKISDAVFKIPMAGQFESLNVSVAAGMILYEAMKQRMQV